MGSRRTSSRPASAVRKPSRWISSCMSANVVVGGTCYETRGYEFHADAQLGLVAYRTKHRVQRSRILERLQQSVILFQTFLPFALHPELAHIANRF